MGFRSIPDVEVSALCDLDQDMLQAQAQKYNIPNTYRIYEDMLASDLDAVVIATPMQLHFQQTIAALQAGKHILCEVTAGVTMDELWWLKEAVEQSNTVYMMAENCCYIPENQIITNMVQQGLFGEVYFGEGEYVHDIKSLAIGDRRNPEKDSNTKTWRNYWQLGKRGAFYPTHSIGPVMKWFKGDRIKAISCMGTGWHTAPQFRQEDTSITLCQMESGKLIKLRVDCISNRPINAAYYTLQGTEGCYEAPRGLGDTHKIWLKSMGDKADQATWRPLSDFNAYLPERYKKVSEEQQSAEHWGSDFYIVHDFVQAIREGTPVAVDVYEACEWTAIGLLSELSIMNGGRVIEMPDFRTVSSFKDQIIKL
jgi:predicted dehydrogenase